MPRARVLFAMSAAAVLTTALLAVDGGPAIAAVTPTSCADNRFFDVNRDGFEDTVVGTPLENAQDPVKEAGYEDTGTVTIVYGNASGTIGLNGGRSLKMRDLGFTMGTGDHFGASVLVADLNGDKCGDLVIGAPGRNKGAGIAVVVFGTPPGSPQIGNGAPVQVLKQGTNGTPDSSEAGDNFGASLAVSRNSDGSTKQLWVGVPGEDIAGRKDAGLVDVYPAATCTSCTLPTSGITHFRQGARGVSGVLEAGDKFGFSLAGGGYTVLVGSPGEDVGSASNAGMFHAFGRTSVKGYTANSAGVPGTAETGDQLGRTVSVAESCAGGTSPAWVVGAPYESIGSAKAAGNVIVMDRGTGTALTFQQGKAPFTGSPETDDHFGAALNYTGSVGRSQGVIAVGVPGENLGSVKDGGQVMAASLSCPAGTLGATSFVTWTRNHADIPGSGTREDAFGAAIGSALVWNGASQEYRLLVSLPGGDEPSANGTLVNSGTVLAMPATSTGFTAAGSVMFGQGLGGSDPLDIPGMGEDKDGFGSALDSSAAGR